MHLIVGLGNPGTKYALNRHNIGFLVIDALADHLRVRVDSEQFKALIGKTKIGANDVILVKPQTFMNLSGEAVQAIMAFYKIPLENLLVIHDEVDIPFAELKFQKNRGHGGQNGIRNIHEKIGSDYARIRMGIGRSPIPQMSTADWVLQNFSKEQSDVLSKFVSRGGEAALAFVEDGFIKAQNAFNT